MAESEVIKYLRSLPALERVKLLSKLAHELNSPLTSIRGLSAIMLEDEPELDELSKGILTGFQEGADGLNGELATLARSTGQKFDEGLSNIFDYATKLDKKLPSDLAVKDPKLLGHIVASQEKFLYVINVMFGFGTTEEFFFKDYLEIYRRLNSGVLADREINLLNQANVFPLRTSTRDYEPVIDNLVGNAIKHAFGTERREGEDPRIIKVTTLANHDPYLVRVTDNGCGLSLSSIVNAALKKNLITADAVNLSALNLAGFIESKGLYVDPDLAFKVHDERDYKRQLLLQMAFLPGISTFGSETTNGLVYAGRGTSSGLGLDIVKELVERNGGNVWVKSHPRSVVSYDQGKTVYASGDTRFYFTIPESKVISKQSR